jgi:hypothetical protein
MLQYRSPTPVGSPASPCPGVRLYINHSGEILDHHPVIRNPPVSTPPYTPCNSRRLRPRRATILRPTICHPLPHLPQMVSVPTQLIPHRLPQRPFRRSVGLNSSVSRVRRVSSVRRTTTFISQRIMWYVHTPAVRLVRVRMWFGLTV